MAHELTASDHMVSGSNVTPWHGLGTIVAGQLSAADALKAARLDWQVGQEVVFDGDMKEIEGFRLNRRSDNGAVLGIVADTWSPIQNERVLEIAEALAQIDGRDFQPVIETAGSLQGGRIVWALVKTGERQFAGSAHASYLLLSNGHDGKRALKGTLTDTRVVCANTLRMAETNASQLFVTHGRGVESRVKTAIETLGWANDATRSTFAIFESLAAVKINADQAAGYFRRLVKDESEEMTSQAQATVAEMMQLYRTGAGNEGKTAFDALNAVTDWIDHKRQFRGNDNLPERRFLFAALGGEGDRMKVQAFRDARKLVAAVS